MASSWRKLRRLRQPSLMAMAMGTEMEVEVEVEVETGMEMEMEGNRRNLEFLFW